jgi:hypothetical protein
VLPHDADHLLALLRRHATPDPPGGEGESERKAEEHTRMVAHDASGGEIVPEGANRAGCAMERELA